MGTAFRAGQYPIKPGNFVQLPEIPKKKPFMIATAWRLPKYVMENIRFFIYIQENIRFFKSIL